MSKPQQMASDRACIDSGYMFLLKHPKGRRRSWTKSSDERWEIVVRGKKCGRLVGSRFIDGSRVAVVKVDKSFYAALPHAVTKRPPRRK